MQHDRAVVASYWLATATQDHAVAIRLSDEMPNVARFQDAARDHSIVALLAECTTAGIAYGASLLDDTRRLDKFYVSSRYPDALGGLDPTTMFGISEASESALRALRFIAFAKHTIASDVDD
jgi:HEPN domain-containing protein